MLKINDIKQLWLGIQGENRSREIQIDASDWVVDHPNGSFSIWIKRPGDAIATATGATYDPDEKVITWSPDSVDTYVAGEGTAEIRMTEGTVIKKTRTVRIGISEAVTGGGSVLGSDWQSYIDEVDRIKSLAVAASNTSVAASETAVEARDDALAAQAEAEAAQDAAEEARDAAQDAQTAAERSALDAQTAQTAAAGSAQAAQTARTGAETARSGAVDAAGNAAQSATAAAASASNAQESADDAAQNADRADQAARDARSGRQDIADDLAAARAAIASDRAEAQSAIATDKSNAESAIQAKGVQTIESIPEDYTNLSNQVIDLNAALSTNYVGLRSYLSSTDDVFSLPMGAYGILPQANQKPANLPSGFASTDNGYVIVLDSEANSTRVAIAVDAYARKIWMRTGYEWLELAKINTVSDMISTITDALETKYVGFRRYLTTEDNCLELALGVYGISPAPNNKPTNLPSGFNTTTSANGYLIVLASEENSTRVAYAIESYRKKIWLFTGNGWNELAYTEQLYNYIASFVNDSLSSFSSDIAPELLHMANMFYISGDKTEANMNQYKFISPSGIQDISSSYPDWWVTEEISVDPLSFYYVTASARSADHWLYAVYDANGNALMHEESTTWDIVSITKKMIYTPYGASKIRIASVYGADGAVLYSAAEKTGKWDGLKWACMGDSLTAVNTRTTKHYHDYIADDTGITVVNLGAGGTGYKKSYNGVSGFMDRVDTIPLDADVVTIFGSGNDNSYEIGNPTDTGTDTLCGCINTTISRIFARITTCNLGIVTPTPWQGYNPADDTNWMARYSAAIVQICKNWGIPCLDLYHCSNLRPWDATFRAAAYSKDDGGGTHPDETGHKLIAPRFEAFLDELLMH